MLLHIPVDERARAGLFLAMQYPVEVPGVSVSNFLRTAATATRGEAPKLRTWVKDVNSAMSALEMDKAFAERSVNEGFSGGEKKRHEILQMELLKPKIAILDETDSGLDVDALRVVSAGVNRVRDTGIGTLLITHYTRILRYIEPDQVHVFFDGRIAESGGKELADRLPCALVVDEAYGDFADENCLDLVKANERVIVTRSFSKSYALAGLRFGFAVAQPHVIEQLLKVKDSYNCDALSIAAATAAIDDQAWLADNRAKIIATRRRLTDDMRSLGYDAVESQANFVWCTHPERPHKPVYEALKSQGILIRYMNYPGWGDGLRITVGTDQEIDAFLACMKTI